MANNNYSTNLRNEEQTRILEIQKGIVAVYVAGEKPSVTPGVAPGVPEKQIYLVNKALRDSFFKKENDGSGKPLDNCTKMSKFSPLMNENMFQYLSFFSCPEFKNTMGLCKYQHKFSIQKNDMFQTKMQTYTKSCDGGFKVGEVINITGKFDYVSFCEGIWHDNAFNDVAITFDATGILEGGQPTKMKKFYYRSFSTGGKGWLSSGLETGDTAFNEYKVTTVQNGKAKIIDLTIHRNSTLNVLPLKIDPYFL